MFVADTLEKGVCPVFKDESFDFSLFLSKLI